MMGNVLTLFCAGILVAAEPVGSAVWHEYEGLVGRTGRDAGAQVRLALWCEEHGLRPQRHQHLAKALLIDRDNGLARGLSGYLEYQGRWLTPEKAGAEIRSNDPRRPALAEYNGRRDRLDEQTAEVKKRIAEGEGKWTVGLARYRAEQNRHLAMERLKLGLWCEKAGLVTEARVEFTTAVNLDAHVEDAWKHLGYVRHDGRWMAAEQAAAEIAEAKAQFEANLRWEPALKKWRGWLNDGQHLANAEEQLAKVTDPRAVIAVQRVFWTGWVDYQARAVRLFGQIDAPASTRALAKASGYCDNDAVRTTAVALLKTRPPQDYIETLVDMIHAPATYAIEPVQGPGSKGVLVVDTPRYHLERSYNAPLPFKLGFNFDGYIGYDLNGLPIAVRGREIKEGISLEAAEYRTMEMILSSQANAIATQEQLEEDARGIDRANARGAVVNARAAAILKETFNAPELNDDEVAWHRWYFDRVGYSYTPPPKVTVTQTAPGFFAPLLISCFAGGTLVRTLDGPRPIEEVRPGEQVLSQNVETGALAFQPVLVAHHNPPCQTVRLTFEGGQVILPSVYHRFWIAGKGWSMARDLKAGDALRLLDGRATVASVETADVVPVFNLTVSSDHAYFVGSIDCLVHDNTIPGAASRPFDGLSQATAKMPASGNAPAGRD